MTKQEGVWRDFAPERGRHHLSFEGEQGLLPELGIIGWLRFTRAFDHALEPDAHPDEYEIHYIVNGEVNWWVEEASYALHAGMALVIRPNETHGSRTGVLEPCEHYWLRISIPEDAPLPGLTLAQTASLKQGFEGFEHRVFSVSSAVSDTFSQLIYEHRSPSEHSALLSRAALHALLVSLIRDYASANADGGHAQISSAIQQCSADIQQNLAAPPTVAQLAKQVELSETAFRKRFRKEIGCSPLDYITRRRIQEAKRLLSQDDACIKAVAHDLGFSSRQYFSTVFKRIAGISPGTFLAESLPTEAIALINERNSA
jgi:AraC-like DNA-binding protein